MKSDLFRFPGLIDVHTHLREPGGIQKEDFETGTKAAVAGGYTQILDMPNNAPSTTTPQALDDKIVRAKGRIWCDLGFNFGAARESAKYFKNIYKKAFGLKVYMNQTTGPLLIDKFADQDLVFKSWSGKLPIMVHAQDETVEIAIKLAKKYKKRIHVCHTTTNQLGPIKKARREGTLITCEVCPHHLLLSRDDLKRLGPLGIMKPPLLSKADQVKLWDSLDLIDVISTDHAPHTLGEKYDKLSPKFGVPGLETALPLLLAAVDKGMVTIERLIAMMSTNPKKIFCLPEQPNTYVEVDLSKKYQISNRGLFTKCGWTPFIGMTGTGKVRKVVIRKKTVFSDGKFMDKPKGQVIYPN
ncbi:hypothetical protein A3D07_04205 [Candidatus Curtissbacteria bacterium RIFCSPHIGHO2_02_FULL_42_15]|uniref:Amidohydrolase-related domain-containing protein n=1 Tax=Candidatus Curtissbacteria bacterium RIFCSPHIGHO2_02_FULL_42_15 TaxID=1797716 RepID=A0A1F5GEE8_9BACT|nr:MAG: hypothetical protein A3D07_04205 [Candidatus Curtissbacteria bacterium RIFCSPHIGHO2_02_FULL_42_15]